MEGKNSRTKSSIVDKMTQQLDALLAELEQMRHAYEDEKLKRLRIEKKYKTLEKKYRQLEKSIRPHIASPERRLRRLNPSLTTESPMSMDISPSLPPVPSTSVAETNNSLPHPQVQQMDVIDLTSPTAGGALSSTTSIDQILERARMNRERRNQEERRQRMEVLVERIGSYTPLQEVRDHRLHSSVSLRTRRSPGASLTRHDDLVDRILSRTPSRSRPSPRPLIHDSMDQRDTQMDASPARTTRESSQSPPSSTSANHSADADAALARRLQLEYLQAYQEEEQQRQRARQQALERQLATYTHRTATTTTTTTGSINPDEMSYDELLRLGEQMGDVKKERWRQVAVQVFSSLPTHRWRNGGTTKEQEEHSCVICQYNFIPNDQLITLPCAHIFHENCVEGWIRENNSCPLCKCEIMAV